MSDLHGLIAALARVDRTKAFLGGLAVALAGFFLPGVLGALILIATVAGLAALLRLTWVATPPLMRVFRLVVLTGLVAVATAKLLA